MADAAVGGEAAGGRRLGALFALPSLGMDTEESQHAR
jgi:hypothetical protein